MVRLFGIAFALFVAACVSLVIQSEVESIQKSFRASSHGVGIFNT